MYTCVIIVCFSSFYDKEAMLMDPVDGPILASLLGTFFFLTVLSVYIATYSDVYFKPINLVLQLAPVLWSTPRLRLQTISGLIHLQMSLYRGIVFTAVTVGRIPPPEDLPWLDSQ